LVQSGQFKPDQLRSLDVLCRPQSFKLVMERLVAERGGKASGYVEQVAVTLTQAARECGRLSNDEIRQVEQLRYKVYRRRLRDTAADVHPDQAILDELDEPGRLDALLSLPARTMAGLGKIKQPDTKTALVVQGAVALELWLACPLRISNFSALRMDQHIHEVKVGRRTRVLVRLAGDETKNGKPYEGYLHDAASDLLRQYLREYQPLIGGGDCPWLFPGRSGSHKHANVISKQMKKFIWDGAGIEFHPHLIRKIVTKLILDADPNNIEIARILLGHSDTRATRQAYTQAQNREAQRRYVDALEQRRLAALTLIDTSQPRERRPRPLRVGNGQRARGAKS
jgi:integrase